MNEAQTRHDLIDPALKEAGWNTLPARIALEQQVAPGRVESDGKSHKPEKADYVLMYGTRRIAVVEAKSDEKSVDAGEAQARRYAEALGVRFAYSTNGRAVRSFDLVSGTTSDVEFLHFPTPAELCDLLARTDEESPLEKICREIPWKTSGNRGVRYYQERAVEGVIKALGRGKKNALITLATGTGKTFISFQLVWKLVQAKWTRKSIGLKKPRVLFLADRNILANQAFESFDFPTNECYRLKAETDNPPMDRTVYFSIYQTLLGKGESDELGENETQEVKFKKFPKDFFDLVIIDECHRGGVNDESAWRVVLDYFSSASHVGLTATPKCDVNGSTYAYFGEPVYQYSLKEGIADGFLTPYRVKKCHSTLSDYRYETGDVIEGNDEELKKEKYYSNDELERDRVQILERDRHFVRELFDVMPYKEKALVFCVTQEHAMRMTHLIREEANRRGVYAPHYCERVTAEDGEIGERFLKEFRNNENEVPTILTTSQKLSTGVDACNVRSIVLMKQVKSMVEFKQIIGRGTRLYDGKPYFTIYDFTDATDKFQDPKWDGEVVCPKCGKNPCACEREKKPCPICGNLPCTCPPKVHPPCPTCGCCPCVCETPVRAGVKIRLSSHRLITAYWEDKVFFDNEMMTAADFLTRFVKAVRSLMKTPQLLRACWADMKERADFIEKMEMIGFNADKLREIQKNTGRIDCDILDVILDIAYNVDPVTRAFRAERAEGMLVGVEGERKSLLAVIMKNYVRDGVWTLTAESFRDLLLQMYTTLGGAYRKLDFKSPIDAMNFYGEIQREIYAA